MMDEYEDDEDDMGGVEPEGVSLKPVVYGLLGLAFFFGFRYCALTVVSPYLEPKAKHVEQRPAEAVVDYNSQNFSSGSVSFGSPGATSVANYTTTTMHPATRCVTKKNETICSQIWEAY